MTSTRMAWSSRFDEDYLCSDNKWVKDHCVQDEDEAFTFLFYYCNIKSQHTSMLKDRWCEPFERDKQCFWIDPDLTKRACFNKAGKKPVIRSGAACPKEWPGDRKEYEWVSDYYYATTGLNWNDYFTRYYDSDGYECGDILKPASERPPSYVIKNPGQLCKNNRWREKYCVLTPSNEYACPIRVQKNKGYITDLGSGFGCVGFTKNRSCWFFDIEQRYCFDEENHKVVQRPSVLCPGEKVDEEMRNNWAKEWPVDSIGVWGDYWDWGTDDDGYDCLKSKKKNCEIKVGLRECKDGKRQGYFVCEKDADCTTDKKTLPDHATAGHCWKDSSRDYKICTATDCDKPYVPKAGWCQTNKNSESVSATPTNEEDDEIVMQGQCLDENGDTGSQDDSAKTSCWCDSHMKTSTKCRLSHMFEGQKDVCSGNDKEAKCNTFCQSKKDDMLQICECLNADTSKDLAQCTTRSISKSQSSEKEVIDEEVINISGLVVDESDNAIVGASVVVGSDPQKSTTTDEKGEFTLAQVPPEAPVYVSHGELKATFVAKEFKDKNEKVVIKKQEESEEGEFHSESAQKSEVKPTPEEEKQKELDEKLKAANDALNKAKEKENSWANRALGATTTAATSLGAMQLAEGIAEKKANEKAEKEMRNYISTMKCEYGGGQEAVLGNEEITLPGGNELLEYYTEYKTLADNLKTTKAALGLRAGIESEVLYDRAQSGLYQYSNVGKTGGGETSLYRALTDTESADATAWSEQKETASKKLKVGGGVAAGGAAVGVIGNAAINTDMIQNIKDAFKKD